jgi:[ribosomal protein S5]-alanine N-acetyltransferase
MSPVRNLPDQTVAVRLVRPGDAATMSRLLTANAEFLAPYEPERSADFASPAGQAGEIARSLERHEAGSAYPGAIVLDGEVVGRINLSNIVRGAAEYADLGYWVARSANGRGVARLAVRDVLLMAFGPLALHRVQAATLVDNLASQRVLVNNGFERIGVARRYLRIAGRWQDHVLFQRLVNDDD